MSDFKREERYIVIKLKPLDDVDIHHLRAYLVENNIGTVDSVVVEADWPEYEPVWSMIEDRVTKEQH
jgi:phosphoribulokinase